MKRFEIKVTENTPWRREVVKDEIFATSKEQAKKRLKACDVTVLSMIEVPVRMPKLFAEQRLEKDRRYEKAHSNLPKLFGVGRNGTHLLRAVR